jgi:hypothetical protein
MTAGITLTAVGVMAFAILTLTCVLLARLCGYWSRADKENARSADRSLSSGGFSLTGSFSLKRYEPLTRLMANSDLAFLHQHSGCPKVAARWNHARRRIIRMYLKDLAVDFRRLHVAARAMVAESPEQNSELVNVLMKQQLVFWREMAGVELWLTASWLGLGRGSAGRLVDAIAALQAELARTIAPMPGPISGPMSAQA